MRKLSLKLKNNRKGITLIALVITIIVLLILAGVSISMLTGRNGIITQASTAKKENSKMELKESLNLAMNAINIRFESQSDNITDILNYYSTKENFIEYSGFDNNEYKIEEYNIKDNNKVTIKFSVNQSEYFATLDLENGCANIIEKVLVNEIAKENATINGEEYSYQNPVIPQGFKPINTTTSNWENATEDYMEGLVIEDENKNQFVWIPVKDITKMINQENGIYTPVLYDWSSDPTGNTIDNSKQYDEPKAIANDESNLEYLNENLNENFNNSEDFEQYLRNDFDNMVDSVKEYGGFYIGRYETSQDEVGVYTKYNMMPMTTADDEQTWYGLYVKQRKKFVTNSTAVVSNMIWDCQYDQLLKWIIESGKSERLSSNQYGNHSGNPVNTGTYGNGSDCLNNIYDLEGNTWDFILGSCNGVTRVLRGGQFVHNKDTILTKYMAGVDEKKNYEGSRMTIYVK